MLDLAQGLPAIKSRPPTAVSFSGGGSRAFTCALAQMAVSARTHAQSRILRQCMRRLSCAWSGLLCLAPARRAPRFCLAAQRCNLTSHECAPPPQALEEMGLMANVKHAFGVSGGGWAVMVMSYAALGASTLSPHRPHRTETCDIHTHNPHG